MRENTNSTSTRNIVSVLITVAIGLVALVLLSFTKKEAGSGNIKVGDNLQSKTASSSSSSDVFQEGNVGGIPYLHCGVAAAPSSSSPIIIDLVLLHGSRFTKEDWRTSGILPKLCAIPNFSVTALDLDKSAGHDELKSVLVAMTKDSLIHKLPAAVVTPSASGKTIVDWLDDIPELKQYISKWIPVAPPAVMRANEEQLKQLAGLLPILAIYGATDAGGKLVSEKLGQLSQATVIEVPGSHPCYLDSPDEFIQHVRAFLE
eukprot:CAMPEP_0119010534 /NCGR_PEP_ID=MMETSP1176-20130426/5079_1 /TAXON_ID=265551 /ORGANISM="Synedropsis recta cf, Strain CCMP1620" /LENGTH=259 /DNA_ID=CAMNT_0006963209 /DNA_START=154 /DNA_END=933 /DNA_ORIENTATION=-